MSWRESLHASGAQFGGLKPGLHRFIAQLWCLGELMFLGHTGLWQLNGQSWQATNQGTAQTIAKVHPQDFL